MVTIAQVSTPTYGLVYQSEKVQLKIGNKMIDTGTLYITNDALAFQPDHTIEGISISWREISVQGISAEPTKCIYFMLDHKLCWRGVYEEQNGAANGINNEGANDEEDDEGNVSDEEGEEMTECWLIPEDPNTVDLIFHSMNDCQALHPDDSISSDELMDNEDDYEDEFDPDARGRMMNLNLN